MVMREALEGYNKVFQLGGNNLRYADDVILTATSEGDLQDLVNRVCLSASDSFATLALYKFTYLLTYLLTYKIQVKELGCW